LRAFFLDGDVVVSIRRAWDGVQRSGMRQEAQDALEAMLAADGPIARALGPSYEPRPEQAIMARRVMEAMTSRGTLLAEAGTGVGKSFAYLVPAMVRCMLLGEKVVVSTHTIALQEQLVERDIPTLAGVIGPLLAEKFGERHGGRELFALKPVLVKGRGNYLSIRRLKLAADRAEMLLADAEARSQLERIVEWAYATRDGTLSSLPQLDRPEVWTHVQSDTDNCMGRKCPHYQDCFYQRARADAETANLLVCNHALFFSDMQLRIMSRGSGGEEDATAGGDGNAAASAAGFGILPSHQHVILDEAHTLEDVASEHLGMSLTEGRIQHLLRSLYEPRRRKGFLAQLASMPMALREPEGVDRAIRRVLEAGEAARVFFERWERLVEGGRAPSGRVMQPNEVENAFSPAMSDLALRLKGLRETMRNEQDRFELNAYARRAEGLAIAATAFVEQRVPESVYWVELGQTRRGRRRIELVSAPIEVSPVLREHLFSGPRSVILASATLATRTARAEEPRERAETAFVHVMGRLGCENASTLQLGSPFDYARQARVIVEGGLASPRRPSSGEFAQVAPEEGARRREWSRGDGQNLDRSLAEAIVRHVSETEGGAFVLFTSFRTLESVGGLLEEPLRERELPLLRQVEGTPRGQLLKDFRKDRRSVLLGAASFWQGVDVRGDGLRCVIITKLPFDPPDRPLTEARWARIKARGGNPFMEDSLPRAVIKFKQGFGRLIRSKADTGRVVVLDSRIVTARYGRVFLEALPEGVVVERGGDQAAC